MTRRVLNAASGGTGVPEDFRHDAEDWAGAKQYEVLPLWVNCFVAQLRRQRAPGLAQMHHLRLAFLIASFAGVLPREAVQDLLPERLTTFTGLRTRRRRTQRSHSPSPDCRRPDSQPWFSLGEGFCAWQVAHVHHRCKLLFPPDSALERMGPSCHWHEASGTAVRVRPFVCDAGRCDLLGQ